MKNLLSLLILFCIFIVQGQAQQDSLYMCPHDTTDIFYGLTFPSFDEPETINFSTDGLLWMTQPDGTATLTGNFIQPNHPENGFVAHVNLENAMGWEDWSNQEAPTSYLNDEGLVTDEYEDWVYYTINGITSTLTGFGTYEGSQLVVSHAPANYFYAYQVGFGANQENLEDGHGGWALLEGTFINSETGVSDTAFRTGIDFYLGYGCEPMVDSVNEENEDSNRFSIYPNPANNLITINAKTGQNNTPLACTIYDAMGRMLLQKTTTLHSIDVSVLRSGSYVLQIEDSSSVERLNFVKE